MHLLFKPITFCLFILALTSCSREINRFKLVTRHNISHSQIDPLSSLSVGNGQFAFTADITGLQTFPEFHEQGISLGTMSDWGWHSFPNPDSFIHQDVARYYRVGTDSVPYYYQYSNDPDERKNEATAWLRENPHRMHLGLIGLEIRKADSSFISIGDIEKPEQELDLWTGELKSRFEIKGVPVEVITLCHPKKDMLAFRIKSPLIAKERIRIKLRFPYSSHDKFGPGYDYSCPEKHSSRVIKNLPGDVVIGRVLDTNSYYVGLQGNFGTGLSESSSHEFSITSPGESEYIELSIQFSPEEIDGQLPGFQETRTRNKEAWENFWMNGGAVDLSESSNPKAFELERRIILSQYLTRIQCAGPLPPQETGLTCNSWHGKFHLEMHWWHMLHFVLWSREHLITKQLDYYFDIEDHAKHKASLQGYQGARWPKMTDPYGGDSPSSIGEFLIWQQPHPIYFADLLLLTHDYDPAILSKYRDLVFMTAEFMVSYARFDSSRMEYILGPALIPAQERFAPETTINPAFELAYWQWGLETAQRWRLLSGRQPDTLWQHVIDHLAGLPVQDGVYLFTEDAVDSWTHSEYLTDHPMVLGLQGMLPPSEKVDSILMRNTLDSILVKWNWETCWGWDFPMAAMNAMSLGKPELALELLLMDAPKNHYLINGHNYQRDNLKLYLPGNGGLLTAMAMICTNGAESNGGTLSLDKWEIRYENLNKMY